MFLAWMTYIKERFPLGTYFILTGGICLSGTLLARGEVLSSTFLVGFMGVLMFFATLRLMDEIKDYEKDKVAHPERPLPRDLIPVKDAEIGVWVLIMTMFAFGVMIGNLFHKISGIIFLFTTLYLWLMYREFYSRGWLEKHQWLYAISHQIVLFLVCSVPVLLANPYWIFEPETYWFGAVVLGAFFSFEISRKLDPNAHPVLRTYRSVYGLQKSFVVIFLALCLSAIGSFKLDLHYLLWPVEIFLVISYIFCASRKHKWVEALASLSLIVHIWAVAFIYLKEWLA